MDNQNQCHKWWRGGKLIFGLLGIMLIVYVGTLINKEIRANKDGMANISVSGVGEILGIKPDVAVFTFSVRKEATKARDAQLQATQVSDKIIAVVKEFGVEDKDIKTTYYNLSPRHDYLQNVGQVFRGYEVEQTFEVKVRNLEVVGEVLVAVTEAGATNIYGPNFEIDEKAQKEYIVEARNAAILRAKEKAQQIADGLGVRLGRITGFSENEGDYYGMKVTSNSMYREAAYDMAAGAPTLPAGETQVSRTVYLTFEIR